MKRLAGHTKSRLSTIGNFTSIAIRFIPYAFLYNIYFTQFMFYLIISD